MLDWGRSIPPFIPYHETENLHSTRRGCAAILFLGLRSSGSVFVYDLVNHYVKNRQLDGKFGDLLFAFYLEGGNRLCFVKNGQQSLSGLRPSVTTDAL